ncbi:MAG: sigma-70 family RNA polymerase sigma factor [Chloroflexi bacterium]|nr:sigma-70 family RNA polymerase sigma factor [Chloroflexota bacterium]
MAEITGDVILRAQRGDRAAFTEMMSYYQNYVYSIAMSVVKDPADAEDLTQEAFIRLLRVLPQYNGDSRFSTWLYRLVINLGRDELRRRSRRVRPALSAPTTDDAPDPVAEIVDDDRQVDPPSAVILSEMQHEMRQAILQLDEQYRTVLTLHYFDDMKYEEISKVLNIPLNTVKSHIRRGKERLMAIIYKHQYETLQLRRSLDSATNSSVTVMKYCGEAV